MAVPKQVQEAGDKALEDLKAMSGKTEDAPKPEGENETPIPKTEDTESIESLKAELEAQKHKYSVLQGKYNAEVSTLKKDVGVLNRQKDEIRNLQKSVDEQTKRNIELTTLLADVQKQISKPKEEKAEVLDFIPSEYLTPEDLQALEDEDLTPKTLKVFAKMAYGIAKKAQPVTETPSSDKDELKANLKELSDRVAKAETETVKSKEQTFIQSVEYRVTGESDPEKATREFDKINTSQGFINWLKQEIPYSDKTIGAALNEAGKRHDVNAVVKIFNDYKQQSATSEPKKNPLEKELEPKPRTDSSLPPDTSATDAMLVKKWGTPDAIREFTNDCSRGKYRGKEAERKKIEAEIWRVNQILLKQ